MEIKMYPSFEEIFATGELRGIFYPLCSVGENLHFVSSNGLWFDEQFCTENNTFAFTKFEITNGKYDFKGDIRLYKGYESAQKIFPILEKDFEENGTKYFRAKMKTAAYIETISKVLPNCADDFDFKYYVQTFYEFSINKLNFRQNGKFGEFRHLIDDWGKHESPIVYTENDNRIEEVLSDFEIINGYQAIGAVIGFEFFTDGNDSILYFNEKTNSILSVNAYS
jgi:hypothetical protein